MKRLIVPPSTLELREMEDSFDERDGYLSISVSDYSSDCDEDADGDCCGLSFDLATQTSSGSSGRRPSSSSSRRLVEAPDDASLWPAEGKHDAIGWLSKAVFHRSHTPSSRSLETTDEIWTDGSQHSSASLLSKTISSLRRSCSRLLILRDSL